MSTPTNSLYNRLERIAKLALIRATVDDREIESPPMDTSSVNSSTSEGQQALTKEAEDRRVSEASTILIQMLNATPEQQNMNTSLVKYTGEPQQALRNEAEDIQVAKLVLILKEVFKVTHEQQNMNTSLVKYTLAGQSQPTLCNDPLDLQLSKVFSILKEKLKESATSLRQDCASKRKSVIRPAPISYCKTCDGDGTAVIKPWEEGQRVLLTPSGKKKKEPCRLMGELDMSFQIPSHYGRARIYLNKMKTPVPGAAPDQQKTCPFSLDERLQGWKIECKIRFCGRCDLFFYHSRARKRFRSAKEAVNFMMYGTYPKPKKENVNKDQGLPKSKRFKYGSTVGIGHPGELNQVDTMKFFEDAYNNLLNCGA